MEEGRLGDRVHWAVALAGTHVDCVPAAVLDPEGEDLLGSDMGADVGDDNGLFPHRDAALARRPYWVTIGECTSSQTPHKGAVRPHDVHLVRIEWITTSRPQLVLSWCDLGNTDN